MLRHLFRSLIFYQFFCCIKITKACGYIVPFSYELIMCAYICISSARNIIMDYDE